MSFILVVTMSASIGVGSYAVGTQETSYYPFSDLKQCLSAKTAVGTYAKNVKTECVSEKELRKRSEVLQVSEKGVEKISMLPPAMSTRPCVYRSLMGWSFLTGYWDCD